MLFVVQPGERNAYDQRALEFDLWNRYDIVTQCHTIMYIATLKHFNMHAFAIEKVTMQNQLCFHLH